MEMVRLKAALALALARVRPRPRARLQLRTTRPLVPRRAVRLAPTLVIALPS